MSDIDPAHARPLLVRAEEAETVGAGPNALRLLVDGGPRDGGVSAIRSTMAKDTDGPPPHFHRAAAEMFFVIEGGLHVLVGSEVHTARAGDFLVVPAHASHAFRTPLDTGVDMLFLMPGAERFDYFRGGAALLRGEADPEEFLRASSERFDNHPHDSPVWTRFLESLRAPGGQDGPVRPD